jgi:plasmid maintenance system antidote protein VapI
MPMKNPPHPSNLIRTEIIEALDLSVSKAADILKVCRATLSDLLQASPPSRGR